MRSWSDSTRLAQRVEDAPRARLARFRLAGHPSSIGTSQPRSLAEGLALAASVTVGWALGYMRKTGRIHSGVAVGSSPAQAGTAGVASANARLDVVPWPTCATAERTWATMFWRPPISETVRSAREVGFLRCSGALVLAQSLVLFHAALLHPFDYDNRIACSHWLASSTPRWPAGSIGTWRWRAGRPTRARHPSDSRVYADVGISMLYAHACSSPVEPLVKKSGASLAGHLLGYPLIFALYLASGALRRWSHGQTASKLQPLVIGFPCLRRSAAGLQRSQAGHRSILVGFQTPPQFCCVRLDVRAAPTAVGSCVLMTEPRAGSRSASTLTVFSRTNSGCCR